MIPTEPKYIIAIGASAGGLEEINIFFDHTPSDGVSYVIVQHLSSVFKSRMIDILAKHSKLVINEVIDGMDIKANEVYLIPHDKFMTIHKGKLYVTEKKSSKAPHFTINNFFNSLAIDCGSKAIAVILSGLGTDGTAGAKAIKDAGGIILARNPETTEFSSMPNSVIATGIVDFVLEPEQMPDIIEDFIKNGDQEVLANDTEEKSIHPILNLIKEQLPFDFSEYKQSTILRRIKRRATYNNYKSIDKYFDFLKTNTSEVEALAKDFLISVTGFFRDKEAFAVLKSGVIAAIFEKLAPEEEIKIWIAGCATGEEAYSMAILFYEYMEETGNNRVVKIFATDIDTVALLNAGKGVFNIDVRKDITKERLSKFFELEPAGYKIKTEIRKMLIFAPHDLVKNPPYCNMHLISCRNLLIYMTPVLQKKVFAMLRFGLKVDGFLFLGSSENPMPIIQHLEVIDKKWKIYRSIESKKLGQFDGFALPQMVDVKDSRIRHSGDELATILNAGLAEAVNDALIKSSDSLAVCVDENNVVVKTYGDTSRYLLQKNFNLNLIELLPRPLVVVYNTIAPEAKKSGKTLTVKGINVQNGSILAKVDFSATPLYIKNIQQHLLMITLTEHTVPGTAGDTEIVFDEKKYHDQYTSIIEEELAELKDKLHATYDQLDASHENMQSYNEELLSANEEMQSTNEEMQSVNEELHTINADYQLKNKELLDLNDDLNNYFRSNVNGQLFVNNELMLMKFSPGTVKLINLLPTDVGRPLSNISTNIKFETLVEDIKEVLATGVVITKEIETNNGLYYQVMTMPYIRHADALTNSNQKFLNNGAILTFNDITELKKVQKALDRKNESLVRINGDLDNFVHVTSHDLIAPLANIELSIGVMNQVGVVDPQLIKFLEVINNSVKKFRSLITEVATVAKIESEMMATELVNMDEVLNNIEWSLESKIKSSNVEIIRQFEVKQIIFSKKNLRSILYNIVANSIKFKGNEKPIVTIHTTQAGDNIELSITDNGIGIPADRINNIFGMYTRLHHDIEGTGIGLYLAKKIIDAAGGNIVVESKLGSGSKFILTFKALPEY